MFISNKMTENHLQSLLQIGKKSYVNRINAVNWYNLHSLQTAYSECEQSNELIHHENKLLMFENRKCIENLIKSPLINKI